MKTKRLPLILIIMLLSIGLDRITKIWAIRELKDEGVRTYLNDFIRLVYAENTGAFLSMGSGLNEQVRYWVLTILPILVLLYVLYMTLFSADMNRIQVASFTFILAGGLSNIFDRLMEGRVVDFLNMGFDGLRTGIFNVADMSIATAQNLLKECFPTQWSEPLQPTYGMANTHMTF